MGRTDAAPVVAIEVLVERDTAAVVGIRLQLGGMAQHRAVAVFILQEDARQSARQLLGNLLDREQRAGARRAFDFEIVAVVVVEFLQRLDDQEIEREPDRSAPVGIAAEVPRVRLRRRVADREIVAVAAEHVRPLEVRARERPHAVVGQEFRFVQHALQQPLHAVSAQQRQQAALAAARRLPMRHQRSLSNSKIYLVT